MTFQELINMTRQEQLSVWIEAGESGNTELEELTMSAMAATQGVDRMSSGRAPQLTPRVIDETEAQRSERLNLLRRMDS